MDLDVDQVLTDILLRPLSAMVEHIPFLYRIAARITRQYPEGILNFNLVAIAKELMIAMSMFELSQYYDFRNTQWRCLFKINGSSSKIASQNWSLRVACSFAAACSSAAADMLMLRVDDVNDDDEQTKNDLRFLTQDFKRISIEFQCVSEMIFGDRPSNPDVVHEHILHSNSSWRISFPPDHENHGIVFNGALPLDILLNVISAVSHLKIALVAIQDLLQTSQDIVNVDLITDLFAELIPVHSFLEYHFPIQIKPAIHAYYSWDRLKLLECAMCDALDVVTMAAVAIQSLKVQKMTGGQVEEDKMRPLSYAASKLFTAAYLFGAIHNKFVRIFSQGGQNS